jgi:hypothetical protein
VIDNTGASRFIRFAPFPAFAVIGCDAFSVDRVLFIHSLGHYREVSRTRPSAA